MALTDLKCKTAQPKLKPYRIWDGGGLYLEITPKGKKYWRKKYYYRGNERRASFGVYPEISLKNARYKREELKQQLSNSIDPAAAKKEEKRIQQLKKVDLFEDIAREWHETKKEVWTPKYSKTVLTRLQADIFPHLGGAPIGDITAPQLLSVLKKIESRGALDIAKRARQTCGQIFRYAVASGYASTDIAYFLKDTLKVAKKSHYSSLTESELPEFFEVLKAYNLTVLTKLAIWFTILTFPRTGEVRAALWSEIDYVKKEWRIPAERMKMGKLHIILKHWSYWLS